ncbi:aldo/keto reductase [Pontibacter oryzae]|uniref:Aldo/keto reductase n=1 Tax=Pontibacter oryzae TaxID=2304593 RepID=A0A399SI01_9BACT|nr:aldo/keto reductase [Pontibacter oryzae]RIJ42489.1 aldo/keto reductase [Pontibacter oryzae]
MNYKTLGKSGLRVSSLCLGTMTFGEDWGIGATPQEAEKILNHYTEAGGNFLDTANVYGNGHSEKIIGDLVGKHSSKRNQMVIGTKFSSSGHAGNPNGGGTGSKSMLENLDNSLRRLQTDYLDIYWVHSWDWHTPFEEVMRSLEHVVASGKVRYLGISNTPAWKIAQSQMYAQVKGWAPFVGLQIEYSLLERSVEDELVPMALEMGLGITPYSPLSGGLLSGKYSRENQGKDQEGRLAAMGGVNLGEKELLILDKLKEIAENHNTTVPATALAWLMSKPGVSAPIIGARKLEHLKSNMEALTVKLSADEIASLDALSVPPPTAVTKNSAFTQSFIHGDIEINGIKPHALPTHMQMQPSSY